MSASYEEKRFQRMADQECISKYFQDNTSNTNFLTNPNTALPNSQDESLNSSQDLSQSSTEDSDILCMSQLTIEEQENLEILPFYNITSRNMPLSPHYIFEEEFSSNPWAMLVATIFLNKTTGKIARPYIKGFFQQYPTPYHVLEDRPTSLEHFFDKIGLRKRAYMIWKLSYQFVSARWRRASDLFGIGKYGEDAYRIFCLGHTDLDPADRYLKLYVDWLRQHTGYLHENGVVDSECFTEDPVTKYYRITLREN